MRVMVVCEYGVGECALFEQCLRDDDQCFLIFNKYHENTQANNECIILISSVCIQSLRNRIPLYHGAPLWVQKHTSEPH